MAGISSIPPRSSRWATALLGAAASLSIAAGAGMASAPASEPAIAEPAGAGGPAGVRRLDQEQYERSIHDIFGPDVNVPGRFDPPVRLDGLMAIGSGSAVVTASGLEQSELRAREIAAQVMAPARRAKALSCTPRSPNAFDEACARAFFAKVGLMLFRRPLGDGELASALAVARNATTVSSDFYKGVEAGLARLLVSPQFVFRMERSEADPSAPGRQRLDAYSLATRIAFLLWNAPPDPELLGAAADGSLDTPAGLARQVDRLLNSPRFVDGTRAFFSDMLSYDRFSGLSKDQGVFPKFTSALARDAQEQTLRTLIDLLVTSRGDYRDIFTTKKTFLNRNLGALYQVPVEPEGLHDWMPYRFSVDDHRAGILTLAAFLMLDPTHEGRSSPTIRGKSLRELLLCEPVPMPPPNVNFAAVQNIGDPLHKTARDRLRVHAEDDSCSGCHRMMDPIGLSMENYDGIGSYRAQENGAAIDASGDLDGHKYGNLLELSQLLHDDPAVPACLVERAYEYGVGRALSQSESRWVEYATQRFAAEHYIFPDLMRRIASSPAFRTVSADRVAAAR
jgi:hypothetical protein